MKVLILATIIAVSHAAHFSDIKEDWLSFKQTHGKKYSSPSEEHHRMTIFLKNKVMIDEHNKNYENGQASFHMKMNHFGDLTAAEFKGLMNRYKKSSSRNTVGSVFIAAENADLPEFIDWRTKGAVTAIKDQGSCGSCWAFSTTGALEGQYFRKTGKLASLSEQQLVDCSGSTGNQGCEGGLMDEAFTYIKNNGGIDSEQAYPYEGRDSRCRFKKSSVVTSDSGFVDIPYGDEEALKKAVATVGPVSVAIDAGEGSFQFYSGGIYYERSCSPDDLDHGVLVVGYGSDNGSDYWLVKNSWNTVWGDQGYIKMARNKNNNCGIASKASYPLL